jgi:hypothetical protein
MYNLPKGSNKRQSRPVAKRTRQKKKGPVQAGGGPTLKLKARVMLEASVNSATSFVRQINLTPYLGLFPTAL